jgi:hypothetical protein
VGVANSERTKGVLAARRRDVSEPEVDSGLQADFQCKFLTKKRDAMNAIVWRKNHKPNPTRRERGAVNGAAARTVAL